MIVPFFLFPISCISGLQSKSEQNTFSFTESINKPPPRAIGPYIERLIKYNNKSESISDPDCGSPEELLDEKSLWLIKDQYERATPWVLREQADNFYHQGNTIQAIDICDFVYRETSSQYCRAKAGAIADKAKYLAEIGDYESAEKALKLSSICFLSGKVNRLQLNYHRSRAEASIAFSKGNLQIAKDKLIETLRYLKLEGETKGFQNQQVIFNFTGNWRKADTMIDLARVSLWSDQLLEAEVWARRAVAIPSDATLSNALLVLAEVFFAQGRFDQSLLLTQTVFSRLQNRCVTKDALIRARTRDMMAQNLMVSKSWKEAAQQYWLIKDELKTAKDTFSRLYEGNRDWALSLILSGNVKEGLAQVNTGISKTRIRYGVEHYLLYEIQGIKAMALSALNRKTEALRFFQSALRGLLSKWQEKDGQGHISAKRDLILKLIVESYLNLVYENSQVTSLNEKLLEEAFSFTQLAQDYAAARALSKSAIRAVLPDSKLSESIRMKQDLEIRVEVLLHMLGSYFSNPNKYKNPNIQIKLEEDISQIKARIENLNRDVKKAYPIYSQAVSPYCVSDSDIRNNLYRDEALVCFFIGENRTYIWVVTKTEPLAFESIDIGKNELSKLVNNLRKGLRPIPAENGLIIPVFDISLSAKLYNYLLAPVAHRWQKCKKLIIVSQEILGQIPFSILIHDEGKGALSTSSGAKLAYRDAQWLAKTHAVTSIPACYSLTTLRSFQAKTDKNKIKFAGFGDPVFYPTNGSGQNEPQKADNVYRATGFRSIPMTRGLSSASLEQLPQLPETADEVKSIALALNANSSDIFLRKAASETTVKNTQLQDRSILIFATHGLAPGDLDGLCEPALALSNPKVTGEKDNDGLLTTSDVMELKLNADLVVLSACNTAAAERGGAQSICGLGQAFFYAGAKSLLVTHWPVETTSAKELTSTFFKKLAQNPYLDRSESLRLSMIEVMKRRSLDGYYYDHPIFWAPFAMVGDSTSTYQEKED